MEELKRLVKVKSLVTLILTGVFSWMAIKGVITGEQFMTVFVMIMTYFFTKKDKTAEQTGDEHDRD